jgi:hypothetical protein
MSGDGYDPKRSTVQDDKLSEFLGLTLSGDLREVSSHFVASNANSIPSTSNHTAMF